MINEEVYINAKYSIILKSDQIIVNYLKSGKIDKISKCKEGIFYYKGSNISNWDNYFKLYIFLYLLFLLKFNEKYFLNSISFYIIIFYLYYLGI